MIAMLTNHKQDVALEIELWGTFQHLHDHVPYHHPAVLFRIFFATKGDAEIAKVAELQQGQTAQAATATVATIIKGLDQAGDD